MKRLWLVLATLCCSTACAAESDGTGSKTNWVECDTEDDCAELPNTSCVKHICAQRGDGSSDTLSTEPTGDASTSATSVDDASDGVPDGSPPVIEAGPPDDTSTDDDNCFSPTSNSEHVYACGIGGCACDSADDAADQCVAGAYGTNYAMRCVDGVWQGVDNSQCAPPEEVRCFNLTDNVDLATSGTIQGCECPESCAEETCEDCGIGQGEFVPMTCTGGRWKVASLDDCDGLAQDLCSGYVYDATHPTDAGTDAGSDAGKDAGTNPDGNTRDDAGIDAGKDAAR